MKKHKMDKYLISKQAWEIDWIIKKMEKEDIQVTKENILYALKEVGRSRRKVYNFLRLTYY